MGSKLWARIKAWLSFKLYIWSYTINESLKPHQRWQESDHLLHTQLISKKKRLMQLAGVEEKN